MNKIFVYDPTIADDKSAVRGIGRYLQILRENFSREFTFTNNLTMKQWNNETIFINPFFNFLSPPLTLKRIAPKQIAIIHDLIPLKYPSHFPAGIKGNINIFLNKLALRNYDLIITVSEASKTDIIKILGIKEDKIKVIYSCLPKIFTISNNQFPTSKQISNFKFQISNSFCLYVGDATWNKNLVNLAKALKIINVTCVFAGKVFENVGNDPRVVPEKGEHGGSPLQNINHPWMTEFKQFLEETKNDKRFIFAGFVPDSELIKLYQQAALNVLPSRDEGFGFSYLEAANFSCPSVLSDIPVLREISDGNAFFVDPKNPHDIADRIGEIYFNLDLRNKLGSQAKKRTLFFSPEKFRREFLLLISS
jgi:glycosyltransferase involved in cell wall biosynthesis